jgi:VWFA-related protein
VTYAGWAPQQDAVLATMRAFMIIAESLSGIPERKALIWASGSFPFYMNSADTSPVHTPAAAQMYERAIPALNQAQISVYPVDVRGLVYYGPTAERNKSGWAAFTNFLTARGQSLSTSIETLQNLAETTGGRAFLQPQRSLGWSSNAPRTTLLRTIGSDTISTHTTTRRDGES